MNKRTRKPNRWIEYVLDAYYAARDAWLDALEAATSLYATEVAEWTAAHPRPTYKSFLVGLAGTF